MAPAAVSGEAIKEVLQGKQAFPQPIRAQGHLDKFKSEVITPIIGTEFPDVNIVDDILNAPNADDLLRDLAVTSE